MISEKYLNILKKYQKNEITEKVIYTNIAKYIKNEKNKETLLKIAEEEVKHYNIWKKYTGEDVAPSKFKIIYYTLTARVLGYTFAIKQMEKRQNKDKFNEETVKAIFEIVPEVVTMKNEEMVHEKELIGLLDEERLQYVGSMVLGLNDALVELTGSLSGYTLAMQSNKLISLAGLITGISATLSMASSEFLSARSDGDPDAARSAMYTGGAYILTVVALILPYLLLPDNMYMVSLGIMLAIVVIIIAGFNYYISVAKDYSFKTRFLEMAGISLGVAAISFVIGIIVKKILGIDL